MTAAIIYALAAVYVFLDWDMEVRNGNVDAELWQVALMGAVWPLMLLGHIGYRIQERRRLNRFSR